MSRETSLDGEMARLVWGATPGRNIMALVRAAIDSSKDHLHGTTCVAGYIARYDDWIAIEEKWNNQLLVLGEKSFHLVAIKRRYPRTWTDVVRPFAQIIRDSNLRSLHSLLLDTDWSARADLHDPQYKKVCPHREHACLDLLFDVLSDEAHLQFRDEPVTVVFDNDWGNNEAVLKLYKSWLERSRRHGFDIFFKGEVPWDGIPLQCADLLAGLLRQDPRTSVQLNTARYDAAVVWDERSEISKLALLATKQGRGTMWSETIAEHVAAILHKMKT